MTASHEHVVDIGDDASGTECRCLAMGCGWRVKKPTRAERLAAAHQHITEVFGPTV